VSKFQKKSAIWYLVASFYLIPLLISLGIIFSTNHLLGDFVSVTVTSSQSELLFAGFLYLLPLVFIGFIAAFAQKVRIGHDNKNYESYLFVLLLIVTALASIFGLPSIGAENLSNFDTVQKAILKFNPTLLFLIFVFSNSSTKRLILSCICILYLGYIQKSLLPIFLVFMGVSTHFVRNKNTSPYKLMLYILLIVGATYSLSDLVSYLYQFRNDLRGSSAIHNSELVVSYAVGRINSFSSFYYILSEGCCSRSPDSFYLVNNFLQRFIAIPLPTFSPTQVFNDDYLGVAAYDYAIFISYAGSLLIEWRENPIFLIATVFTAFVLIFMAYKLTPLPSNKEKLPLFLLLFYSPYLSGEAWEFSIMIQSLVVIRLTLYVALIFRRSFKLSSRKYKSTTNDNPLINLE
jgi:hypothetical protein